MIKVLVIDDEEPFRRLLKNELSRKGFSVAVAADGGAALKLLNEQLFDVVLLDIVMPGMDGLSLMKDLNEADASPPPIVVLTGRATVETAVEAMKNGAFDYLSKPYKLDELTVVITRASEFGKLRTKSRLLEQELVRKESPFELVGASRQLQEVLALVRKVAPTDSPVLIEGESGTGKELVANTIWHSSTRNASPFIPLNCASLPESLIESELFGHEKGAFTSAVQMKNGLVEVADQGTLFLDEIGDMPAAIQAKLLRFLDSGEFRRVGGNKTLKSNVRVIAATNRDLTALTKTKDFREDLYYRLNVITIAIPPLRERKEDIPALARSFLDKYAKKLSKPVPALAPAALRVLEAYHWPGNVRELENVIERAVIVCDSDRITPNELSIGRSTAREEGAASRSLKEMEKEHILRVLQESGGNQSRAIQVLGIDRKTLYLKLRKYGIGTVREEE